MDRLPNAPAPPAITSGIRIGTPAVTSRGMDEKDMREIAECIYLAAADFENSADAIRERVGVLCAEHPLY